LKLIVDKTCLKLFTETELIAGNGKLFQQNMATGLIPEFNKCMGARVESI